MKNTTRKHIWPMSLVMGLAVIGALAVIVALTALPGTALAQGEPTNPFGTAPEPAIPDTIASSSTSGDASIQLTLTLGSPGELVAGSSVVLYLEDDYQVPGNVDLSGVYFIGQGIGRVYATDAVVVDDDDYFGGDDDWSLQVYVPDMNPGNDTGFDAWSMDAAKGLKLVLDKPAGIKNPTEAGSHSIGYAVLGAGEDAPDPPPMRLDDLKTVAKISLSADDGGRGKELTVTGTGFNNGTGAQVRVLVKTDGAPSCLDILTMGEKLGETSVGGNDKFTVTFNVHQDDFKPGAVNYLCAADSEAGNPRFASAVKVFELTPIISVDPTSGSYGDEITLKARDFGGQLSEISLGPTHMWTNDGVANDHFSVSIHSNDYKFKLPGGLDEQIQVAAKGPAPKHTRKTTTLTVEPSHLKLSKSEVVANDSIIIEGRGFDDEATIDVSMITLDGQPLAVERAGTEGGKVQVDSNGQFVIETRIWTLGSGSNPAMDADTYTIKVTDSTGFVGEADVTILEPSIMITPDVAGPRDYVTVTGTNWPESTEDRDFQVTISIDDRQRTQSIDSSGRFTHEVRLSSDISLGEEHEVTVRFDFGGENIEEDTTFRTPDSGITVNPDQARPGDTISLELLGMPVYTLVNQVRIAGANRLGNVVVNTDRDGNATVPGILVPAVDAGFYSVQVTVGSETAVAQLEILSDAAAVGTATQLPDAVSELGDNLEAIFHFNNTTKEWTFFDPRPEFADLNTISEMVAGQTYWVLVKEDQSGVRWNTQTVNFTCAGGDCWNLIGW